MDFSLLLKIYFIQDFADLGFYTFSGLNNVFILEFLFIFLNNNFNGLAKDFLSWIYYISSSVSWFYSLFYIASFKGLINK